MVEQTGCDAVMIGRMAPSNPWIFRQIEQYTAWLSEGHSSGAQTSADSGELALARTAEGGCPYVGRDAYEQPTEADRYYMIHTYFRMLIEEELPDAQGKMKQFASWFTHGVPGGAALRKAIYESKSAPEILVRVEEFFAPVLQLV